MAAVLKLFLLFLSLVLVSAQEPGPTVKILHGVLQGTWKTSTKGRTYASFQGVPYARPPVGKNRFREPLQVKPWVGVWDSTKLLPQCLQYDPLIDKVEGVSHGDDVITMFEYPGIERLSPEDRKMLEELLDLAYTYATTGVPKFGKNSPKWTPVKAGAADLDYLDISSPTKVEMKSTADFGQKSFWDSIGFFENENFKQNNKDEL